MLGSGTTAGDQLEDLPYEFSQSVDQDHNLGLIMTKGKS